MSGPSNEQIDLFAGAPPDEAWSYSRLKSLRRCALEFKVRWIDGQHSLFQPGHIDVQAGRLLHRIAREYYRSPQGPEAHRRLLAIYNKLAPAEPRWKEDLQGEQRVLRALHDFSYSRAARFRGAGLEVVCKARIGGVVFVGEADVVYEPERRAGSYGLLELKLTDVEVRAEDPAERFLQCVIYYLGLPERYRRFARVLSIYVFDSGQLLEAKVDESLVAGALRIVEATIPRAEGPDFPPTLNPFCPSCGYQALCPAYSKRGKTTQRFP
jgi:CRISPR/Cas system-associated exonuclease Cas4 (RecB family)